MQRGVEDDHEHTQITPAGVRDPDPPTRVVVPRPAPFVQRRALELYAIPVLMYHRRPIDHVALWGGTIATAVVAGLIAMLGVVGARALLDADILSPRGEGGFGATTAYRLTFHATLAALGAGALAQALAYVTPRPLLFFRLITSLTTLLLTLWPFTTAAGLLAKVVTSVVYLSLGAAVSGLTALVTRHAGALL